MIGAYVCVMSERKYIRDGRAPVPRHSRTSALMSRIRAKNTTPELILRRALRLAGLKGYRLHFAKVPGRPDITFVGPKVAVFVHGCFWHGCPYCRPRRPKTHKGFWNDKLDRNKVRDRRKSKALRAAGWRVVTIWECQVERDPDRQAGRVARALEGRSP